MFRPYPNGKRFRSHGNPLFIQIGIGIPGSLSNCQHQRIAGDRFLPVPIPQTHLSDSFHPHVYSCQAGLKANFSPHLQDFPAKILHHFTQPVRAHMRLSQILYLLRRPRLPQKMQHFIPPAVFGTGGKLSIGKCPCAAFSKEGVALRIRYAAAPVLFHIGGTSGYLLSPLYYQGRIPLLRQKPGRKYSCRAKARHHDPPLSGPAAVGQGRFFFLPYGLGMKFGVL